MSSSREIQAIRRQEERFPTDLSRDGRTYVRETVCNPEYRTCRRHVQKLKLPTKEQITMIVRLHRVSA
jgi:hypothetical protein